MRNFFKRSALLLLTLVMAAAFMPLTALDAYADLPPEGEDPYADYIIIEIGKTYTVDYKEFPSFNGFRFFDGDKYENYSIYMRYDTTDPEDYLLVEHSYRTESGGWAFSELAVNDYYLFVPYLTQDNPSVTVNNEILKRSEEQNLGVWSSRTSGVIEFRVDATPVSAVDQETPAIVKKANTLKATATGKTPVIKYSKLKKANQTILRSKVITVSKNKGPVTYTRYKGNKKIIINKTTGKITVKKGLKKGIYAVTVKVKAAGNKYYKAKTIKVKIKVKVA